MWPALAALIALGAAPEGCNFEVTPGVGAGPVRLGMTVKQLAALGFAQASTTPDWWTREHLVARVDKGVVVLVEANATATIKLCAPAMPTEKCGAMLQPARAGGQWDDCPALGVSVAHAGPANLLHHVRVYPPAASAPPRSAR